jgi:hypothetical protein
MMRTFLIMLSLVVVAASVLASPAAAKEGGIELSSVPTGVDPGEPWGTSLRLVGGDDAMLAQAKPGVIIQNVDTGRQVNFPARPTSDPREFYVRLVFPGGGWWTLEAYDGVTGRSQTIGAGQYFVDGPANLPVAGGSATDEGFPVWPAVGAGLTLLLAAAGAAFVLRRQRLGLSH